MAHLGSKGGQGGGSTQMDVDVGGQGGGGDKRQAMLTVNNLQYLLEPDLSVAVNSTHKQHFFQSQEYTNEQRGICILNSGADYIDTTRSYLNLRLTNNSTSKLNFGPTGSVLNIIQRITVSSRSGDELCRIRGVNLLQQMKCPYQMDTQWHRTVGELIGYGGSIRGGESKVFIIPMYMLCDFFGYGRLLPSMLMSGLRIEIEWENPKVSFKYSKAPPLNTSAPIDGEFWVAKGINTTGTGHMDGEVPTAVTITANDHIMLWRPEDPIDEETTPIVNPTYKVDNIYFNLKSVQLTDATQRALNELSAVNGLEIVYCDWETTDHVSDTSSIHIEVRKASSRALKAILRQRPTANVAEYDQHSFLSTQFQYLEYQWQLGSLYFPQQPIKTRTGSDRTAAKEGCAPEAYAQTLDCFDKFQPNSRPPLMRLHQKVTYDGNMRLPTWGEQQMDHVGFDEYGATIGVTLERSSLFNLAGIPINNSRVLSFRSSLASATGMTNTIFLKYVKLARVFLNNVEVEQ